MVADNNLKIAKVALSITGAGLDLDAVSAELQMRPSHTHRVGDASIIGRKYQHDMWQLETPISENESLDTHLKWLAARFRPHYEYLKSLKNNAEIVVYCGFNCDDEQSGFSVSPEALAIFTELEIPLDVHILSDFGDSD